MARSPDVCRVIEAWGLSGGAIDPDVVRRIPPELVLDEHDGAGVHVRPARPRPSPISSLEVELLNQVDSSSLEPALDILLRARGTANEIQLARAIPYAAPERARIEAAYLLVANRRRSEALALLEDVVAEPAPTSHAAPALVLPSGPTHPGREARVRDDIGGEALARELRFIDKTRKIFHPKLPYGDYRKAPGQPGAAPPPAPTIDADVAALACLGLSRGPTASEVCTILRASRGTAQGVRALRSALSARAHGPLPQVVREVCAELLVELGYNERALELLADAPIAPPPSPPPPGIDVDTPITERDARHRASAAERVLATDLDRLGVSERHGRLAAVARAAELTVDAFRALGGRDKREALSESARDLERHGEAARAAEMYALGGDDGEANRLGVPAKQPQPPERLVAVLDALDRRGLRLAALHGARTSLRVAPDPVVAAFARGVIARLVRGPIVDIVLDHQPGRVIFADVVTIGRMGAVISLPTPLLSRCHVAIRRLGGAVIVEDLGSHNGTWLAGARIAGPLSVGAGLDLMLGREIPLSIRAAGDTVTLEIAGDRYLAPLGPLALPGLLLTRQVRAGETVITLRADPGATASIGETPIHTPIELSLGDIVRVTAPEPWELGILG